MSLQINTTAQAATIPKTATALSVSTPNAGASDAAIAIVAASGIWGAMQDQWFLSTMLPTLAGSVLHVYWRAKAREIVGFDIIAALCVAAAIGFWGGPYFAALAPQTEKAVAPFCFGAAYFATDTLKALKNIILGFARALKDGAAHVIKGLAGAAVNAALEEKSKDDSEADQRKDQ